ncbi:unnamed protein product [Owenia fusiformis]|uniref:Uncharacterized protein n=1 Tax=Owenia fusiformis TaxID=6347 RepID=A0A8J1TKH8_OWEFU|nr:unnamed protein product [Owenia fusiformis]
MATEQLFRFYNDRNYVRRTKSMEQPRSMGPTLIGVGPNENIELVPYRPRSSGTKNDVDKRFLRRSHSAVEHPMGRGYRNQPISTRLDAPLMLIPVAKPTSNSFMEYIEQLRQKRESTVVPVAEVSKFSLSSSRYHDNQNSSRKTSPVIHRGLVRRNKSAGDKPTYMLDTNKSLNLQTAYHSKRRVQFDNRAKSAPGTRAYTEDSELPTSEENHTKHKDEYSNNESFGLKGKHATLHSNKFELHGNSQKKDFCLLCFAERFNLKNAKELKSWIEQDPRKVSSFIVLLQDRGPPPLSTLCFVGDAWVKEIVEVHSLEATLVHLHSSTAHIDDWLL